MLYVLVFGVTFENWDPFNLSGVLSITRVSSVFYILSCIPFLKSEFEYLFLRKYLIPLLVFLIIALVTTAFNGVYASSPIQLVNTRLVQLIILMVFVSNHLLSGEVEINSVLYTFLASMLLMYILFLVGAGVEFVNGRLLLFGENPNTIGMKAAVALLILVTIILDFKINFWKLILLFLTAAALMNLVILSASRGALATVILGMGLLALFSKLSVGKKVIFTLLGTVMVFGFIAYILVNNPVFAERILNTVESGDTGRNHLWVAAFQIIANNPYAGVGLEGVIPEMFKYSGRMSAPHNIFLWIFIATGIFGFITFLIFLGTLFFNLMSSFKVHKRVIYLLLFIVLLFNMSKTGGGITKILFWFFLAILIGSTTTSPKLEKL